MPLPQHEDYTTEDIYHLPEGTRAELIDGQIYYMAPPTRTHQKLLFSISRTIADYIDSKKGICEVDIAPFAVFLNEDTPAWEIPSTWATSSAFKNSGHLRISCGDMRWKI